MDEARKWRWIDIALAIIAAVIVAYGVLVLNWSAFVVFVVMLFGQGELGGSLSGLSAPLVRRFIMSREDDATRP